MNLFQAAIRRQNDGRPPIWFMRQAGRYHAHYQNLRKTHSFIDLCKKPEVACEATMGPVRDFGFDAAILFSDLLFPLEAMGMGLKYEDGPKLDWHLKTPKDLETMGGGAQLADKLQFQGEAMALIRKALPADKGLLGFVGGPLTLYCYAVEGTHSGQLLSSREGIKDGRYDAFVERLLDLLAENMAIQARAGADTIAVMDTCAGEFDPQLYRERVVPQLARLYEKFQKLCPGHPLAYYSKGTGPKHWKELADLPLSYVGIDWNHDLPEVLREYGGRWAIQGNIDPHWLFLEPADLEKRVREIYTRVRALPASARRGWISGLGHGVLPKTPENNVRLVIQLNHEFFGGVQ